MLSRNNRWSPALTWSFVFPLSSQFFVFLYKVYILPFWTTKHAVTFTLTPLILFLWLVIHSLKILLKIPLNLFCVRNTLSSFYLEDCAAFQLNKTKIVHLLSVPLLWSQPHSSLWVWPATLDLLICCHHPAAGSSVLSLPHPAFGTSEAVVCVTFSSSMYSEDVT